MTKFISLFCMELSRPDEDSSKITYTNAGHCPPILFRNGGSVERLGVTGGVLGVHEDFSYEEASRDIHSGDMVALFTDGVVEAMNRYGEAFEEPRLIDFLIGKRDVSPSKIITDLVEEVRKFTGETRMEDDFTFILLKKR